MSARPTLRVPEAAGAAAGGLVSQRSAEAGSAAEVKTALTRNRLRCTSALHRAVEVAMVSVQPVGSCRPRSPGRLLGVMPSSVSETFRPRALLEDHGDQFGDRRAWLFSRQPPQDRRVITPHAGHAPGRSEVNDPARQALVGHYSLVQQRP